MEKELEQTNELENTVSVEAEQVIPNDEIVEDVVIDVPVEAEVIETVIPEQPLTIEEPKVVISEPKPAPVAVEVPKIEVPVRINKRILTGKVVSNKADKTITIAVQRQVAHPLYKKYFKRTTKFMAHDELNECRIGDTVKVIESRPLSARKRWKLIEIVLRAK